MRGNDDRKVCVNFISDEDVRKVIILEKGKLLSKDRQCLNEKKTALLLSPLKDLDDVELDLGASVKPTALLEASDQNVFGFRTPKKEGTLLEKAYSANRRSSIKLTPTTPNLLRSPRVMALQRTPGTPNLSRRSKQLFPISPKTPTRTRTPKRCSKLFKVETPKNTPLKVENNSDTPYSFRCRVKGRIKKIVYDSASDEELDDSDEDNSYSPNKSDNSDDDFEDNRDENYNLTPLRSFRKPFQDIGQTPGRTVRKIKKTKVDVDVATSTDDYFIQNSESFVTSDYTLSHLEVPRLAPEALRSLLKDTSTNHIKEKKELVSDHRSQFPSWMISLYEGFSIFLCGVGSKKSLLSDFQMDFLSEEDHLVINGFFPSLTIKNVLFSILEEIMEVKSHPQGIIEQLKLIEEYYSQPFSSHLFLIINNLDGPLLRVEKAQYALSQLAAVKNIHIIASLDHINAPLMFNASKLSCYNPLWYDTTTFAPYTEETCYENSLLVQQTGSLAISSLSHVFKSLTPNTKGLFVLLAEHQLKQIEDKSYTGLPFGDLYQKCRASFLVNSDLTLRTLLTEFRDHKLIQTKKGYDGIENLWIPLDHGTLQEFLEQYHSEN